MSAEPLFDTTIYPVFGDDHRAALLQQGECFKQCSSIAQALLEDADSHSYTDSDSKNKDNTLLLSFNSSFSHISLREIWGTQDRGWERRIHNPVYPSLT
jgi:hypothetical protein